MRSRVALAVAAAVLAVAEPAWACSTVYSNPFSDLARSPVTDAVRSAAFIDWGEVEIEGPPPCEPPRRLTPEQVEALDAAWEAWEAAAEPKPEPPEPVLPPGPRKTVEGQLTRTCQYTPATSPIYPLKARVIESLRGGGGAQFSLAYRWTSRDPWHAYTDPRTRMVEVQNGDEELTVRAIKGHGVAAFFDRGHFMWLRDATDSCGGERTALIGERYLAFRSADGSVIALEAVPDRDDPWFDRVRRFTATEGDYPPSLDVADFFRASKGVALVRLNSCKVDPNGWRFGAKVRAEVLRGAFDAGDMADREIVELEPNIWGTRAPAGTSFNWIAEYLDQIRAPCRPGMLLIAMSGPFDRDGESPPRAARVVDGRVRVADLLTGYRLTGPRGITVNQAFRWVAEGRLGS